MAINFENNRPRFRPRLTAFDKTVEVLGWALLLLFWLMFYRFYADLPEVIPTHFNGSGEPDGYGSRASAWGLPAITTVLFLGLSWLSRYPHLYNYAVELTPDNFARQYQIAMRLLRWMKLVIVLVFGAIFYQTVLVATTNQTHLGKWVLPASMGLIFGSVIFFLIAASRDPKKA